MQRDIDALEAKLQQTEKGLDQQQANLTEQTEQVKESINEVDRALQDLNRAARMTDADFGIQLERLIREVQELRGMVELVDYRVGQIEGKLEGEGSLGERVIRLEGGNPSSDPAPTTLPSEVPDAPREMLSYARGLSKQGKKDEARGVFRQIIKKAPKSAGITDAAFFELGSIYYAEKKYRSALQEFIKVVEGFEKGSYADDAYFKIGECSMDLGNLEDAKVFFGEVIKKKSKLSNAAKKRIAAIDKKLASEKRKR